MTSQNSFENGELDCTPKFMEQISKLYLNSCYSDIIFVVEEEKLHAHKSILAARSSYFRALLFGGLSESSQNEIELKAPLNAFKAILQFVCTGRLSLRQMDNETIFDTLSLAHEYGIEEVEAIIPTYLTNNLSLQNCCEMLSAASVYDITQLKDNTMLFMDKNATALLNSVKFKELSRQLLCTLLERDSFYAPEVDIFKAVLDWSKNQNSDDVQIVSSYVRFPLMNLEELTTIVRESSIIDSDRILGVIHEKAVNKSLSYRGIHEYEVNVATTELNARVINGLEPMNLLNGSVTEYDEDSGYTLHVIENSVSSCIIVRLGDIYTINHLKMLLWDRDDRSYSYYVEVSENHIDWVRVVDHSNLLCRSWQDLYFAPRAVRYIKVVGTQNTANKSFHVVSLGAYYTKNEPKLLNGLVIAKENVASVHKGAKVIEGQTGTHNEVLAQTYLGSFR